MSDTSAAHAGECTTGTDSPRFCRIRLSRADNDARPAPNGLPDDGETSEQLASRCFGSVDRRPGTRQRAPQVGDARPLASEPLNVHRSVHRRPAPAAAAEIALRGNSKTWSARPDHSPCGPAPEPGDREPASVPTASAVRARVHAPEPAEGAAPLDAALGHGLWRPNESSATATPTQSGDGDLR